MPPIDDGAWVAYPYAGGQPGTGGDAYGVMFFGNTENAELLALRYANTHDGYRAVYIVAGESILDAETHRD